MVPHVSCRFSLKPIESKTQSVLLPRLGTLAYNSFALEAASAADVDVKELCHRVFLRDHVAFRGARGVALDLLFTATWILLDDHDGDILSKFGTHKMHQFIVQSRSDESMWLNWLSLSVHFRLHSE